MAYTKNTNFTAKDALATGNPSKIIKGSELDGEFDEIATEDALSAKLASTQTFTGDNVFTGLVTLNKGADVASATALPLISDGNYFDVTGTTTITSFNSLGVGTQIKLHFDDALTLTHHATDLILPSGDDITTAAGDEAEFVEYASGDWRCTSYTKANGIPVTTALLAEQEVTGSDVTTITFTGLDMNTHKSYRIEIEHFSEATTGGIVSMYANNDTTATNYYNGYVFGVATAVTGARNNDATITSAAANSRTYTAIDVGYATGLYVIAHSRCNQNIGANTNFLGYTWSKTSPVTTNLTRLDFTAGIASGLRVGTKIRIYRGDV